MLVYILVNGQRINLKHQKEIYEKWIDGNVLILKTKNVILHININDNKKG